MERIPSIWELMEAIYKDGKEESFIKHNVTDIQPTNNTFFQI